jgi:hypothetical protein
LWLCGREWLWGQRCFREWLWAFGIVGMGIWDGLAGRGKICTDLEGIRIDVDWDGEVEWDLVRSGPEPRRRSCLVGRMVCTLHRTGP